MPALCDLVIPTDAGAVPAAFDPEDLVESLEREARRTAAFLPPDLPPSPVRPFAAGRYTPAHLAKLAREYPEAFRLIGERYLADDEEKSRKNRFNQHEK